MTMTWRSQDEPSPPRPGPRGWLRIAWVGPLLALVNFGGLALFALVRLPERLLVKGPGPLTPWLTVGVCRLSLWLLGIRRIVRGAPMTGRGAAVANHASWLDIYALNAGHPLCFVAKAEVAGWAGIGWLARATGTVFIRRYRRHAQAQVAQMRARLAAGERLMFFPEGTSTDGLRVLPFRSVLFEALGGDGGAVQPVSVRWRAPAGQDVRFFGWWGGMDFLPHLLAVIALGRGGEVRVSYLTPVAANGDRKALAAATEVAVRAGYVAALAAAGHVAAQAAGGHVAAQAAGGHVAAQAAGGQAAQTPPQE